MRKSAPDLAAAICAAAFIVVLAVAAYWDRSIRTLHVVEALPYLLAGVLALRQSKVGYALGVAGGAVWLFIAAFLSSFVRNGFEWLFVLLRTGEVHRPDLLIAVPAAISAGGLAFFCLIGYARLPRKSAKDALLFAAALVLVPAFFIGIFALFAPQFLGVFRGILPAS